MVMKEWRKRHPKREQRHFLTKVEIVFGSSELLDGFFVVGIGREGIAVVEERGS